jgi:hypothetical protein
VSEPLLTKWMREAADDPIFDSDSTDDWAAFWGNAMTWSARQFGWYSDFAEVE